MDVTRRGLMAAGLSAAALPAWAATEAFPATLIRRSPGRRDYAAAVDAIRQCAQAELVATGLPGMVLSLVGDDGFEASLCLGWADLATRTPVRPDHLFEIGSISKSLAAVALWQLAAAGRVDLAVPVARALPLACLPPQPITPQQLLDHVAGLADGAPIPPNVPGGRLWTAATPGTHFSYSNTGYELIGLLVGALAGRPHPAVIRERVLVPMGMTGAVAHITDAERTRLATGYVPGADLPPLFGLPLVEGPWNEMDEAAGSIAATVADMGAYLRFVIGLGRGRGGELLPDAAAKAMLARPVEAKALGGGYSSGFMRTQVEGRPMLHHTGGMMLFTSSFDVDAAEGVGAFASTNGTLGEHRPVSVTAYAVRALRAARLGKAPPSLPDPYASRRVERPERYVGHWMSADGATLEIDRAGDALRLRADGESGRAERMGDILATDLPGFRAGPLEFSHAAKEAREGQPYDRLWYRDRAFARDRPPPSAVPTPSDLAALAGDYRTPNPWFGSVDVVTRGDRLVVPGLGPLVREPVGHWHAEEDKGGYERFWFDTPVAGRPYRLIWSGADFRRLS
jgi:CubicO group peptidase (beta-lactamase class C family)